MVIDESDAFMHGAKLDAVCTWVTFLDSLFA